MPLPRLRVFAPHSLGRQVMGLVAVVLLMILLLFTGAATPFVFRAETEAWRGRQGEAARNAAMAVAAVVRRAQDTLVLISVLDAGRLRGQAGVDPELNQLLRQNATLEEVIRLDAAGGVFAVAHRGRAVLASLITIPQSQWFLNAREGRLYLGPVQVAADDQPYLILAIPAPDGGAVAARVRMSVLWQAVAEIRFGQAGRAYVITRAGDVVAHTDPQVVLAHTQMADRPEFAALRAAPGGEWFGEYASLEGAAVVGATAPVPNTDWMVVAELPQSEAFVTTRIAVLALGGGLLALMLATLALTARLVDRLVVQPMAQLREGAARLGAGDLDHRIQLARPDEIGQVARAFDDMAGRLQERSAQVAAQTAALQLSETRYRAIVEDQTELICRYRPDGALSFINEAYSRYFGLPREALLGRHFRPRVPAEDLPRLAALATQLGPANPLGVIEHRVILPDGSLRWQRWTNRAVLDESGQVVELQAVGQDVTERKQAEAEVLASEERLRQLNGELEDRVRRRTAELSRVNQELTAEVAERQRADAQLKASLREKMVMLQEIHHRVKNNLQVISSLLNLQSQSISDPATLELLRDSQNRVRSMALVHEKLYRSSDLARIDLAEYAQGLAAQLRRSYADAAGRVSLQVEAAGCWVDVDTAVPCGLILNELVSNALKHAFPPGRAGMITISLRPDPDGPVRLVVADDGVGFPATVDFRSSPSLGLQLVNSLVAQIDGVITLNRAAGTTFTIAFPAPGALPSGLAEVPPC